MAGDELMKRVGFIAGARPPPSVLVVKPNSHWCATTAPTPSRARSLAMVGCAQLVAPAGCWVLVQEVPAAQHLQFVDSGGKCEQHLCCTKAGSYTHLTLPTTSPAPLSVAPSSYK